MIKCVCVYVCISGDKGVVNWSKMAVKIIKGGENRWPSGSGPIPLGLTVLSPIHVLFTAKGQRGSKSLPKIFGIFFSLIV